MGNSNSKWTEERAETAESKWTYRNGQVMYAAAFKGGGGGNVTF